MKQDGPLVSVVVPIYNVEKYLEDCLHTVIAQTYKNIEVILVDDGATDNSGKIADKLAKKNKNFVVIHKNNGGLSDARNAGIRAAKGEYITFVDSDDCIDIIFVENLMQAIMESGADIAQCNNSRKLYQLGRGSGKLTTLNGGNAFVELMRFKSISPTAWGKIYKISLFRDNNLEFPVGRIHEDTAILYKLIYSASKVVCIDKVLYYYRVNNNSIMTANYTKEHHNSVTKYHEELDEFIAKNHIAIEKKVIYKHKALRLLSILNKLALAGDSNSTAYTSFTREYRMLARRSESLVCIAGLVPVRLPGIFRWIKKVTPIMRTVLGKM